MLILHQFNHLELGLDYNALSDVHDSNSLRNDYVQVVFEDITAEKKFQNHEFQFPYKISLFAVQNIGSIFLKGSSSFTDIYGSVFGVINSKIVPTL